MEKFNRIQTIELLRKAIDVYNDIMTNYNDVLPRNITDGAERTINDDLPNRINILIDILNLSEKKEKYKKIKNLDEALDFLKNEDLDKSIEVASLNEDLVGYSTSRDEILSFEDILDNLSFAVDSGVQYLLLQRAAGKLSKGEF